MALFGLKLGQNESYSLHGPFKPLLALREHVFGGEKIQTTKIYRQTPDQPLQRPLCSAICLGGYWEALGLGGYWGPLWAWGAPRLAIWAWVVLGSGVAQVSDLGLGGYSGLGGLMLLGGCSGNGLGRGAG